MTWLAGLVVVAMVMMAGAAVRYTVRNGMAMRRAHHGITLARGYFDLVARDVAAGSRIPEAVEHSVIVVAGSSWEREIHTVGTAVRLGARPRDLYRAELGVQMPLWQEFLRAWDHTERYGISLVELARGLVADCDARLHHLDKSRTAMAGARFTMLILLILPMGALAIGQLSGLDPLRFLLGNPIGWVLCLAGSALASVGVGMSEMLATRVLGEHGGEVLEHARAFDLCAAAVAAGLPLARAWGLGFPSAAAGADESVPRPLVAFLRRCRGPEAHVSPAHIPALLGLGAGADAWLALSEDPLFRTVVLQAAQQTRSGAAWAEACRHHAAELRFLACNQSTAAAERVLVTLAVPLTLCFLPAFVLLGLLPLSFALAGI